MSWPGCLKNERRWEGTVFFLLPDGIFKVVDYQMVVTDAGSYTAISLGGQYYDQDYGYVELITNEPFRYYAADEYPSCGKLTLYGAIGVGYGETSAVITAIDATHCRVEVDSVGISTCSVLYDSIIWSDV